MDGGVSGNRSLNRDTACAHDRHAQTRPNSRCGPGGEIASPQNSKAPTAVCPLLLFQPCSRHLIDCEAQRITESSMSAISI